MVRHRGTVPVDTNVILEAHRTGFWRALTGGYAVETVEDCVTETQTGFQRRRPEHPPPPPPTPTPSRASKSTPSSSAPKAPRALDAVLVTCPPTPCRPRPKPRHQLASPVSTWTPTSSEWQPLSTAESLTTGPANRAVPLELECSQVFFRSNRLYPSQEVTTTLENRVATLTCMLGLGRARRASLLTSRSRCSDSLGIDRCV